MGNTELLTKEHVLEKAYAGKGSKREGRIGEEGPAMPPFEMHELHLSYSSNVSGGWLYK